MNSTAKDYATELVKYDPEFANDLYFALDDIFVKKTSWHTELTKIVHNWANTKPVITEYASIEDAGDGSGDGILTFPEGFCETQGWKVGDTLDLFASSDGNLIISKK